MSIRGRILLVLLMLGALVASERVRAQPSERDSATWAQDRFLIGAWEGPQIHRGLAMTRHTMARARRAGIDVILKSRGTVQEVSRHVDEALRVAAELGMQIVVSHDAISYEKDWRPCPPRSGKRASSCAEGVACGIDAYRNHPHRDRIFGYLIKDEPRFEDLADVRCRADAVRRYDPRRAAVVNLYPSAWEPLRNSESRYREYLEAFVNGDDGLGLPFLSFDHYYYLAGYYGGGPPSYFRNLRTAREVAGAKPLWAVVASSGFDGLPAPTLSQLRFMACVPIAYGAKGIAYFKYSGENGLIVDANDSAAVTFEPIARMNRYLKAVAGPVVFADSLVGVFHQSARPTNEALPERERLDPARTPLVARSSNTEALVAVYRSRTDPSARHLWVVNKGTRRVATDFELKGDFRGRVRAPVSMEAFTGDTMYVQVPVRYSSSSRRTTVAVTLDGGAAGMFRVLGVSD